jgi:hypothetical protein
MTPLPADATPPANAQADHDIAGVAAELVACGSLEMGAEAPDNAQRIAELLPAGTPVYVNHLPSRELDHALPALVAAVDHGVGADLRAHRIRPGSEPAVRSPSRTRWMPLTMPLLATFPASWNMPSGPRLRPIRLTGNGNWPSGAARIT